MENFFVESPENGGLGEKKFRAKQVLQWIHQRGESDFSAMSNLAKNLRQILIEKTQISLPPIIKNHLSDDNSRKFLFDVGNHNANIKQEFSRIIVGEMIIRENSCLMLAIIMP